MISLTIRGAGLVIGQFRSIGQKVAANARKRLHASADRVEREAKLNTPRDKWNLEESIHQETDYEGPRGRLKIDVVAGGVVNGVDTSEYGIMVHEDYEGSVAYVNGPGEGTREKMAENPGRYIGSKFLERALEEEQARIMPDMDRAVRLGIEGADEFGDEEE